ncbi:MAG: ABC transporter substrate-binding protein [Chloroflexi bacterium]|nr:ABC transporter substrate-binding protein [Chloroflexota bacterium]
MRRTICLLLLFLFIVGLPVLTYAQEGTLNVRGLGNVSTYNFILNSDGASFGAYALLWPSAFRPDPFTSEWVPSLTSWEISEDGLTYTFHIREDANWSDGVPISSADIKFVIDAIQSDLVPSPHTDEVNSIVAVNIIDDKTYELVLDQPNCAALGDFFGIRFMPSHRFAADFSDMETNPLNTFPDISGGPFILEEIVPDSFQRYRANPDYYEGPPGVATLINHVLENNELMLLAIEAGEIDYANMQGDIFQQLSQSARDELQVQFFPANSLGFVLINWADPENPQPAYDDGGNLIEQDPHPIFTDINVRKAIAMGFSVEDIMATLGENGATRALSVVAPAASWAFNADIEPYPYDPDAAIALLEESGWVDSDGDGVREKDGQLLEFTVSYSDIVNYFETTSIIMQDQLSQIGFQVNVEQVEWSTYLNDVFRGQRFDVTPISFTVPSAPDPDQFTTLVRSSNDVPGSGNNVSSYINLRTDELIDAGVRVPGCDNEARAEIYHELQQILYEDVAIHFTLSPSFYQLAANHVGNFVPGAAWAFYGYLEWLQTWTVDQ